MSHDEQKKNRFNIDPASVAAMRAELQGIVQGNPIGEAAVDGFNDWQVIEAMERLWTAATSETAPSVVSAPPSNRTSESASSDSSPGAAD